MARWTRLLAIPATMFLAAATGAGATGALAQEAPECAAIQNALLYNQCLAKHGPVVHGSRAIPMPADPDRLGASVSEVPTRVGGAMRVTRKHGGRMVLELTVSPSRR